MNKIKAAHDPFCLIYFGGRCDCERPTTRAGLVSQLQRHGYHSAADCVRHSAIPGNTMASLCDIQDYFWERLPGASDILSKFIERNGN